LTYLSCPLGGRLDKLEVSRGQEVARGQLVFKLESQPQEAALQESRRRLVQARANLADLGKGARPSELEALEAKLAQARHALDLSRREYQRRSSLRKSGALPQEDLDRMRTSFRSDEARVRQAEAELATARLGARTDRLEAARAEVEAVQAAENQARWALEQKQSLAPAAGRVFDTFYRPGEEVPANRPVAALLIPGDVKVRFFVPEEQLAGIALEQPVDLICDGCPQGLEGRVSYISPEAEYTPPVIYSRQTQAKLVFMLEAIPQGDAAARLHPGQPMEVRLKPSRSDS
jgi:HlyD family secretion protein